MSDENVGPIPVVADQKTKRLRAIVTDRDLAIKIVAPARNIQSVTVEEVMSRDPVTCHADDDLQKAVDAMEKHQVRRIPVVDDKNQIVGSSPRLILQRERKNLKRPLKWSGRSQRWHPLNIHFCVTEEN